MNKKQKTNIKTGLILVYACVCFVAAPIFSYLMIWWFSHDVHWSLAEANYTEFEAKAYEYGLLPDAFSIIGDVPVNVYNFHGESFTIADETKINLLKDVPMHYKSEKLEFVESSSYLDSKSFVEKNFNLSAKDYVHLDLTLCHSFIFSESNNIGYYIIFDGDNRHLVTSWELSEELTKAFVSTLEAIKGENA